MCLEEVTATRHALDAQGADQIGRRLRQRTARLAKLRLVG
jgi:hypothetical protein